MLSGNSSKSITFLSIGVVFAGTVIYGASLWFRHIGSPEKATAQNIPSKIQEGVANPLDSDTRKPSTAATPTVVDSPAAKEQEWIRDNLPPQDFYKGGVQTLGGSPAGLTSEHDVFKVEASDNQIWNMTIVQRTDTTYFPGTPEERKGHDQEQTTCSVQFMKIPWKKSWIDEKSVSTTEDRTDQLSEKYELVIVADKDDLGCVSESQFGDQPSQSYEGGPELRLVFPDHQAAEIARRAIIAHTTLVRPESP